MLSAGNNTRKNEMYAVDIGNLEFTVSGPDKTEKTDAVITEEKESGIYYCDFNIRESFSCLVFYIPLIEIHGIWAPHLRYSRGLGFDSDTLGSVTTDISSWAPVTSLYSYKDINTFTVALSDPLNRIYMTGGVNEESVSYRFEFRFLSPGIKNIRFRFDTRKIRFSEVLSDVSKWWDEYCGFNPSTVPFSANRPFYSTWYSYHQFLDEDSILEECRKAAALGMEGIFIDDGWQTDDTGRGYACCGDWNTVSGKIADMGSLVGKIHDIGLNVILWYAVPYAGIYTEAYNRFKDKLLVINPSYDKWFVLDPRYPDVREFVVSNYINAVHNWDVDGIKLDFISRFSRYVENENPFKEGMDCFSIPLAEYILFNEIREKLSQIKPDILLECRQEYIGPAVRTLGNLFRAEDCPACSLTNRVSIIDIRLLAGKTSVHSDPIMWNTCDSVESASMQMSNAFFGVPQISMKLGELPESHTEMLSFYLRTWKEWADVITEGDFSVTAPSANYQTASAFLNGRMLFINYSAQMIDIKEYIGEALIINSSYNDKLILEIPDNAEAHINVYNCKGEEISRLETVNSDKTIQICTEPGGMIFLEII